MTLRPTADIVAAAGGATLAVNVITLEHAEAIVAGSERAGNPVLLQLSQNAVRFHGGLRPLLAACRELARAAAVPVGIHLDHLDDPALVDEVIGLARQYQVGSMMVDFATLEFESNVAATADAVRRGRAEGLWIEAELGEVGGKDGAHAPGVRTDPAEAAAFVLATGVDALAVAVGSSHAMRERSASLDIELVRRLAGAVRVPLVLHGSSGVPDDVLAAAVAAGIRKVNVGTALNIAGTAATRSALAERPELVDPRPVVVAARSAMADVVTHLSRIVS